MDAKWIWKNGILGGLIAGIVFAIVEVISAMVSGGAALPIFATGMNTTQNASLGALFTGATLVGLIVSMILGVIIAWIIAGVHALHSSGSAVFWTATAAGFVLFLIEWATSAGAGTATGTNQFVQFLLFTVGFGMVLGWYCASQLDDMHETHTHRAATTSPAYRR